MVIQLGSMGFQAEPSSPTVPTLHHHFQNFQQVTISMLRGDCMQPSFQTDIIMKVQNPMLTLQHLRHQAASTLRSPTSEPPHPVTPSEVLLEQIDQQDKSEWPVPEACAGSWSVPCAESSQWWERWMCPTNWHPAHQQGDQRPGEDYSNICRDHEKCAGADLDDTCARPQASCFRKG